MDAVYLFWIERYELQARGAKEVMYLPRIVQRTGCDDADYSWSQPCLQDVTNTLHGSGMCSRAVGIPSLRIVNVLRPVQAHSDLDVAGREEICPSLIDQGCVGLNVMNHSSGVCESSIHHRKGIVEEFQARK
jgi:hypothetical protein